MTLTPFVNFSKYGYLVPFIWGLVVISSFIGWGIIVHKILYKKSHCKPDWGLCAGWGMALSLFIGGFLNLICMARPAILVIYVILGSAIHIFTLFFRSRSGYRAKHLLPARLLNYLPAILLVTIYYAGSVAITGFNAGDDHLGYIPLVKRMLQTGTLIEPFSLRRLAAFGGQTFLQAIILSVGSVKNMKLMDIGISPIILFGLITGFFNKNKSISIQAQVFIIFALLFIPYPSSANTSSTGTGIIMFFTLFRTIDLMNNSDLLEKRFCWLLGLILAGITSLKTSFFVPAFGVIVFIFLGKHLYLFREKLGQILLAFGKIVFAWVAFLLPWSLVLYISSDTFFWPIMRGNQPLYYDCFSGPFNLREMFRLFTFFATPRVIPLLLPIIVLIQNRKKYLASQSVYFGAILGTCTILVSFSYANYGNHFYRYTFPFLFAAYISSIVSMLACGSAQKDNNSNAGKSAFILSIVFCALSLNIYLESGAALLQNRLDNLSNQIFNTDRYLSQSKYHAYKDMQAAVPEGSTMLVRVSEPFALDFTRNKIYNLDSVGGASLEANMPFFQGPERIKAYLKKHSISYLAFNSGNKDGHYRRELWEERNKKSPFRIRCSAKFSLDIMDNFDILVKTEKVIYERDKLIVIKIE
jgi:hypothetical protein